MCTLSDAYAALCIAWPVNDTQTSVSGSANPGALSTQCFDS